MTFTAPKGSVISFDERGWIDIVWGPLIDADEYMAIAAQMLAMVTAVEERQQRPIGVIDFSKLEDITAEAAALATKATRDLGFARIAGFGIKSQHRVILDTIKANSTKADTIRDFPDRVRAEAWLLS
jgi:hypothetical protein